MKEFFGKRTLVYIIIFLIAFVMIGTGIVLVSGDTKRTDIQLYNQGVSIYNEANLVIPWDILTVSVPDFPIEKIVSASAYFQQSVVQSTDNRLKSLALYNSGTMIGRDYLIFVAERIQELHVVDAISMLAEAVRLDPNNEDAKYNLEYLEKIQPLLLAKIGQQAAGSTSVNIIINRGY